MFDFWYVERTLPAAHAAFNNVCTFGHGSGARFLNGAQSTSDMRSKIAALTEGRARMRVHQTRSAEKYEKLATLLAASRVDTAALLRV